MICSPCTISRAPDTPLRNDLILRATIAARAVFVLLAAVMLTACGEDAPPLPALAADLSGTSVSGLSSGAYMAGQFHIAHSGMTVGAGLVAGGPYGCAESVFGKMTPVWSMALAQNLNRAVNGCTGTAMASLGVPNVDRLAGLARRRAEEGKIDSIDGISGDRIYLFTGKADNTVAPSLVRAAREFYERLGAKRGNVSFVEKDGAGHGFLTEDAGNACGASATPFLNDCDYDQAGAILKHIYGSLQPPGAEADGEIMLFAQKEFSFDSGDSLDERGAVFVPDSCAREAGCRVHVAYHGCEQGHAAVGDAFIRGAGYNRWAATNRIIVLYPQVTTNVLNPKGCWDWWGYTGPEFLTRNAPQVRAVRAMLARLAE